MASRKQRAAKIGREHGYNAATWVFDGNTTAHTYRATLAGIEDGDPLIMDQLGDRVPTLDPGRREYTGRDLARDLSLDRDALTDAERDEIDTAYLDAASGAFWDEVERAARYQLS